MIRRVRNKFKKLWAELALFGIEMVIVTLLFYAALAIFVYMVRRVFILHNNAFDKSVYEFMGRYVSDTTNSIMQFFTFLGTHYFLIPANILLVIYFLFIRKHKWHTLRISAVALSSVALMFLLKSFFARTRPLDPLLEAARGLSFPSGHALNAVTFYGLLGYITWHTVKNNWIRGIIFSLLVFIVFMIGISRVYLHVHYMSDVIAGYCMGVIWLYVSLKILRRLEKYSGKKLEPIITDTIED
jgi:membrane-associated phospholipid phosphatase